MNYTQYQIPSSKIAIVPKISQVNDENCNPHHIDALSENMILVGQEEPGHVLEINEPLLVMIEKEFGKADAAEVRRLRDEEGKTHLLINGTHRLFALMNAHEKTKQDRFTKFDSYVVPTGTFSTRLELKSQQFKWNLFPSVIFQRPTISTVQSLMEEWVDNEHFGSDYSADDITSVPSKAHKLHQLVKNEMWDMLKRCGGEYSKADVEKLASDVVYVKNKGKRSDEQTTFRTKTKFKKEALDRFGFKRTNVPNECGHVLMVHDDNDLNSSIYGEVFRTLASVHSHGKFDKQKPIEFYLAFNVRRGKDKDLTAKENAERIDKCIKSATKDCERMNHFLKKNNIPAKFVSLNTMGQKHSEDPNTWYATKLKSKTS